MIWLTGRTSLLVALYLLTSAATAQAECAWVLWAESTGPPNYEASISPVSSSDTRQQCEQALAKQVMNVKRVFAKSDVTVDELSGTPRVMASRKAADGSVLMTVFRYQCLPDAVDPRGPKGGAR